MYQILFHVYLYYNNTGITNLLTLKYVSYSIDFKIDYYKSRDWSNIIQCSPEKQTTTHI